jgi:hypothetical protein
MVSFHASNGRHSDIIHGPHADTIYAEKGNISDRPVCFSCRTITLKNLRDIRKPPQAKHPWDTKP